MITRIRVRNFKKLHKVDIELGSSVVLIGPNNSGKTTALQALALWEVGLKRWNEKRSGQSSPESRPGVTINRRDLISIPTPDANLLWRDMHVRNVERRKNKPQTKPVFIDIIVDGVTEGSAWSCGFEFYYANAESIYCRPLRKNEGKHPARMGVPDEASSVSVSYLPPMSGLAAIEPKWEPGRINVLLGEGQTAQVLRNLCYQIYEKPPDDSSWEDLNRHIHSLFGATISPPKYIQERGEVTMGYKELGSKELDISVSGRGFQQTLLLLAYLYAQQNTVLLIDEPDAHLEILRQRQIYQLLTEITRNQGSQIISASHSEIVLNEAADRDIVIAFVGNPHRVDDRGSQALKSLRELGYDQYYQAEQVGWVLYLEGSTDLAILKTFAQKLGHRSSELLERPFVHYVGNNPAAARHHFFGLREAKTDLVGIGIFDRIESDLRKEQSLTEIMWTRREIENYLCVEEALYRYATHGQPADLFGDAEAKHRETIMRESIQELTEALSTLKRSDPWSPDLKTSDDFLNPLFERYFEKLELPNLLRKTNYHVLAGLLEKEEIDLEVVEKLDAIASVAEQAKPTVLREL